MDVLTDVLTDYLHILSPKDLISLSLVNREWRHVISQNKNYILSKMFNISFKNTDIHLQDLYIVWNRMNRNRTYDFNDSIRFCLQNTYVSSANTTMVLTSLCNKANNLWASYYLFSYLWSIRGSEFFVDIYDLVNTKVHQALYECMLRRRSRNKEKLMPVLLELSHYIRDTGNALRKIDSI